MSRIIFSHLPKTGGIYIREVLFRVFGKKNIILADHAIFSKSAADIIIGTIRNPWEYYVSCWAVGCDNFGELHKEGQGFRGEQYKFVPNKALYKSSYSKENFKEWLILLFNNPMWGCTNKTWKNKYSYSLEFGMLSHRICTMYLEGNYDLLGKSTGKADFMIINYGRENSNLAKQILHIAKHLNIKCSCTEEELSNITSDYEGGGSKPGLANYSLHHHYIYYYDDEIRELVLEKDKLIIEQYKFEF